MKRFLSTVLFALIVTLAISGLVVFDRPSATSLTDDKVKVLGPGLTTSELFMSEYIEGSSNNKAIEIYNDTGAAINLTTATYNIQVFSNGSPTATSTTNLTGTVANGDVYVIANTLAGATILGQADQTSANINFNGNDAVVLRKGTTIIDVIGQIGNDPTATGWGVDPTNTTDNTIVRKSTVCAGDPNGADAFNPATEWNGFLIDTFTNLGTHSATCVIGRIHDIQGAAHISPLVGQVINGIPGIVTARVNNGFWMQDPSPDADIATSEGIFVFTSSVPTVSVGDSVTVNGTVSEFRSGGGGSTNLTITEITTPVVVLQSSGNPLPPPVVIGSGGRVPPVAVIEDDATGDVETSGVFDPAIDGIDFYESMEGMHVQVNNPVAVGTRNQFGELPVLGDNGAGATLRAARGGIVVQATDFNPERIILDDVLVAGATPIVNVGDGFTSPAVGVLDYTVGNFKLQVMQALTAVPGGIVAESTAAQTTNQLAVANFNLENLDPGDVTEFPQFASQIVNNLRSPDILVVEEVQDNNGPANDSTVDASVTFNTLIAAIATAGGPAYSYRQIDPVDDQDGGEPGGNIRIGFLFRTDRGLAFVDRPGGTSTTPTAVVNNGGVPELSLSPGRIDPTNPAFSNSRKSIAGEFTYNGHRIFVIGNHFNSKGGDQPLFGRFQPPALPSDIQRTQQAQIINNFVDSILAVDANAKVLVAGDLNDFEFSGPVNTLEGGVLNNLTESLPANERYNFIFEGNSQALGHILLSNGLFARFAAYDIVHFESEFAVQTSDHDPQIARLLLFAGPTAAAVSVAGRVLDDHGRGIKDAVLVLEGGGLIEPRVARTNPFGYYSFDDLGTGTYTLAIRARRHIFAVPIRTFALRDSIVDFDFVAEP